MNNKDVIHKCYIRPNPTGSKDTLNGKVVQRKFTYLEVATLNRAHRLQYPEKKQVCQKINNQTKQSKPTAQNLKNLPSSVRLSETPLNDWAVENGSKPQTLTATFYNDMLLENSVDTIFILFTVKNTSPHS